MRGCNTREKHCSSYDLWEAGKNTEGQSFVCLDEDLNLPDMFGLMALAFRRGKKL